MTMMTDEHADEIMQRVAESEAAAQRALLEARAERMHAEQVLEPASEDVRDSFRAMIARNHWVDLATSVLSGRAG